MKTLRNFFTLLIILSLAGCQVSDPKDSVARVRVSGGQGSCTYVAHDGRYAVWLTARHVGERAGNRGTITCMATGQELECEVLEVVNDTSGFESDMCLLISDIPEQIQPVQIAEFNPANAPFTCYGYKGDQFYESVAESATDEGGRIKLSSPLTPGMSGGPCFDRWGRQVGIGVGTSPTYGIASDGIYLKRLVDKYSQ